MQEIDSPDPSGNEDPGSETIAVEDQIRRLTAKLEQVLGEKKKLALRVRQAEAAEAERRALEAQRQEEEQRQRGEWDKLEQSWKSKLEAAENRFFEAKARYDQLQIDLEMGKALDGIGVKPEFRRAVSILFRQQADIDDEGHVTVDGKSLSDCLTEWARTDEGKAFIAHNSSGGVDLPLHWTGQQPASKAEKLYGTREDRLNGIRAMFPDLKT